MTSPKSGTGNKDLYTHDTTLPFKSIEFHTVVQFGHDLEMQLYMFGGFLDGQILSSSLFRINFVNNKKGVMIYEQEEVKVFERTPIARH